MSLLTAERIKLTSTRAPWICTAIALVASYGFTLIYLTLSGPEVQVTVVNTQVFARFGATVMLVAAVLAASGEYHWGTMRLTFQAVPSRTPALLAKGAVVGLWCGVTGLVVGFGSWGMGMVAKSDAPLALHSGADWRAVAGQGLVFLLTGVLGVGVGLLVRSTAFALTLVIVWTQLVEGLVQLIPHFGPAVYKWLPFVASSQFIGSSVSASGARPSGYPLSPLGYGAYFAAICLVVFAAGVVLNNRKDA